MPKWAKKRSRKDATKATLSPNEQDDYSSSSYWEQRYREGVSWEWYFGFQQLQPLFERFVPKTARVLEVGCGDKPLAWDLRADGYTGKICSFDFAPSVISQLDKEKKDCMEKRDDTDTEFMVKVMDAREVEFEANSFDLVVDKGTIDAMLCSEEGKDNARLICCEAGRVLAWDGWFMVVSHVSPDTAEGMELLSEALLVGLRDSTPASESMWSVDAHCGAGSDEEDREEERTPCVYMIQKRKRRFTRSSMQRDGLDVSIRVHEY
ncbi:unnamed protein product [Choristocarpus tenellus]